MDQKHLNVTQYSKKNKLRQQIRNKALAETLKEFNAKEKNYIVQQQFEQEQFEQERKELITNNLYIPYPKFRSMLDENTFKQDATQAKYASLSKQIMKSYRRNIILVNEGYQTPHIEKVKNANWGKGKSFKTQTDIHL